MRIPYEQLQGEFSRVLSKYGFDDEQKSLCSKLFAQASLDGVASHGLNRFPLFIEYIKNKYVIPNNRPESIKSFGVFEQWDGKLGPGPNNGCYAMGRAIDLSKNQGVGVVAMRNTNHWMRGGNFGWQAAEAGCIGICWSNTKPNMPAWQTRHNVLGNNPLIISIPQENGEHLVWDAAMSQFSFGKIQTYFLQKKTLPFPGGYDKEGQPSQDPTKILETSLGMPMGFWKGAGLALMLDIIAAVLSEGQATHQFGHGSDEEFGLSQVFIALKINQLVDAEKANAIVSDILTNLQQSEPMQEGRPVVYPGESTLARRNENLEKGVPVEKEIWEKVKSL